MPSKRIYGSMVMREPAPILMPGPYDTILPLAQELAFRAWKQQIAPLDSGADYDYRGAFLAGLSPDPKTGHWVDTYKKPNHPTFSVESQYAKDAPDLAGSWDGETYIPPKVKAKAK